MKTHVADTKPTVSKGTPTNFRQQVATSASDGAKAGRIKSFKLDPQQTTDWPRGVKVGSVVVKVYRRTRADGSNGFEVADYSTGNRRLASCPTETAALAEAKRIADLLASGDVEAASMRNSEAASFGRAVELLRPTGTSLELCAAHFAKAFEILGGDKIVAAAEYYAAHSPDKLTRRTVAEVVAEVIASKEGKRTENTISDLRNRLDTFAKAFNVDIASVTTSDVQGWLDGLKVAERTRLNYRLKVSQLFTFAARRNYIPKRSNPVADTERPDPAEGEVTTYTAKEIAALLAAASKDFLPCVALSAFAGLRTSEIQRLSWQDIDLARGHIKASGRKRGTPSRRFVPITDNLRQWLVTYAKRTGLVWLKSETDRKRAEDLFSDAQVATADAAKVAWKKNALRHSFISYRLAEIENTNAVALEAGNSPATLFKHYRELVTKAEAKAWFAVSPKQPANVTSLAAAKGN